MKIASASSTKRIGLLRAGFALFTGLIAINVAHAQGQGQQAAPAQMQSLKAQVEALTTQVQGLTTQVQGLSEQAQGANATILCLNAPTVLVEIPLLARGSYSVTGSALPAPTINLVGRPLFQGAPLGPYRNYFVFDLGVLGENDLVVGAQLITFNPANGFGSDTTDTLTYALNRVSTSATALKNGTAGTAGYLDLADGPVYGTYVASAAVNGSQIVISLSDKAVRDINASRHNGFGGVFEPYLFAMGGAIAELNTGITGNAYFLAFAQDLPLTNTGLDLNVRKYPSTCPLPAATQYQ
jgi:hypothetical protein